MHRVHPVPLVSIGIPVFNGERGIARCLESVLGQDYPNLEIIISDNASTDRTAEICRSYAAHDARIKYFRELENRGGVWNFNRVFELATGDYFMWSAHDDERDPAFVNACVTALEQNPDAVLCQAHTLAVMEDSGAPLYIARLETFEPDGGLSARYRKTLRYLPATALYGLFRTSAMRWTRLLTQVIASDLAFLQELAIYGRFVEVRRVLFQYGLGQTWNTIDQDARHFLSRRKPWYYVPFVMLAIEHAKRVAGAPIPAFTKLRLWACLANHEIRHVVRTIALKLAGAVCPERRKEELCVAMYYRLLHNPNVQVLDPTLFVERVCKPQVGWWR